MNKILEDIEFITGSASFYYQKTLELQKQIEELKKDRDRFEWVMKNRSISNKEKPLMATPDSIRLAIDRAMNK